MAIIQLELVQAVSSTYDFSVVLYEKALVPIRVEIPLVCKRCNAPSPLAGILRKGTHGGVGAGVARRGQRRRRFKSDGALEP